jgi:putative CocE/NonD family hydrolase
MKRIPAWAYFPVILLILFAGLAPLLSQTPPAAPAAAKFGDYKGAGQAPYDSWVRTSLYLPMRDGVRLAVDILRPARKGAVETKPLPAIWTHTRYRRASVVNGKIHSSLEAPHLMALLRRGYVLAAVDVRGAGASFGVFRGIFTPEESQDAYEITEWLARQPWCDGAIGMFGASYLGITQLMAAARKPPHLKAIMPMVALFDLYDMGSPGGVLRDDFIRTWSALTGHLDNDPGAAPVDEDRDGRLLKAALEEHKQNRSLWEAMAPLRFRNDKDPLTGTVPNQDWQPAGVLKAVNESGIPVYLFGGWQDSFTRDQFLLWRNLAVPKRLTIGAWSHSPKDKDLVKEEVVLLTIESLRWYDHWLKGQETGLQNEDPLFYQVMRGPKASEWRSGKDWPVAGAEAVDLYLGQGRTGSIASVNDGRLRTAAPKAGRADDAFTVAYTATSGTTTRWDNAVGGGFGYPDMAANDLKGLTYTTAPLLEDLQVTGTPVLRLWVASTAADADVFAYLEEIDPKGVSTYVTEGVLRASRRALGTAPYDNLGWPYHRGYPEDVQPLTPGQPVELLFEMQPTATVFDKGNRLRLSLAGADKDNAATPQLDPAPVLTVYRDKSRPSSLRLPVVGAVRLPQDGTKLPLALVMGLTFFIIILTIVFAIYMRKRVKPQR